MGALNREALRTLDAVFQSAAWANADEVARAAAAPTGGGDDGDAGSEGSAANGSVPAEEKFEFLSGFTPGLGAHWQSELATFSAPVPGCRRQYVGALRKPLKRRLRPMPTPSWQGDFAAESPGVSAVSPASGAPSPQPSPPAGGADAAPGEGAAQAPGPEQDQEGGEPPQAASAEGAPAPEAAPEAAAQDAEQQQQQQEGSAAEEGAPEAAAAQPVAAEEGEAASQGSEAAPPTEAGSSPQSARTRSRPAPLGDDAPPARRGRSPTRTVVTKCVATVQRLELTAFAAMVNDLQDDRRQFGVSAQNVDLKWLLSPEGRASLLETRMDLLNFDDEYLLRTGVGLVPPSKVLINSPRSALVLLRNGVAPLQLLRPLPSHIFQEAHLEGISRGAARARLLHFEKKRRRELATLRGQYAEMCKQISLEQIVQFFAEYDPLMPCEVPRIEGLPEDGMSPQSGKRPRAGGTSPQAASPRSVFSPRGLTSPASAASPRSPQTERAHLARQAFLTKYDPAFTQLRNKLMEESPEFRAMALKLDKSREKMKAVLRGETNRQLKTLAERQNSQHQRLRSMQKHDAKLQQVQADRVDQAELRQMSAEAKVQRRTQQLRALHEKQLRELAEKELKEGRMQKARAELAAALQQQRRQRRDELDRQAAARKEARKQAELEQQQQQLMRAAAKEKGFRRVQQRRERWQQELIEKNAQAKLESDARIAAKAQWRDGELQEQRDSILTRARVVEERLKRWEGENAARRDLQREHDFLQAHARGLMRLERQREEEAEFQRRTEQREERRRNHEERQRQRKREKAVEAELQRLRRADQLERVERSYCAREFQQLQVHDDLLRKRDSVNRLQMQVDLMVCRTRGERENLKTERNLTRSALFDAEVRCEKLLYREAFESSRRADPWELRAARIKARQSRQQLASTLHTHPSSASPTAVLAALSRRTETPETAGAAPSRPTGTPETPGGP